MGKCLYPNRFSDIDEILESFGSSTIKANGTNVATPSIEIPAGSKYIIIAVSNGAVGYAYNDNSYVDINWTFSETTVTFSGGESKLLKEQTPIFGSYDGALSYKAYYVEADLNNVIITASASVLPKNEQTSPAKSGSTFVTLFAVRLPL